MEARRRKFEGKSEVNVNEKKVISLKSADADTLVEKNVQEKVKKRPKLQRHQHGRGGHVGHVR
jgi:hypothetical protein